MDLTRSTLQWLSPRVLRHSRSLSFNGGGRASVGVGIVISRGKSYFETWVKICNKLKKAGVVTSISLSSAYKSLNGFPSSEAGITLSSHSASQVGLLAGTGRVLRSLFRRDSRMSERVGGI